MKKILLFASAALLFAGCAKENLVPSDGNDNRKGELTLSFTASQAGFGTKAAIGETTTDAEGHNSTAINWQSTDKISVFDGAGENCAFSTKDFSAETPTSCTFEGKVSELANDYTAVYPYTEAATISGDVISGITLPATQTAVEGSFDTNAALMAAKTVDGGRDLAFQNLVGYVKVATDFDCTKIELCAASEEALAGEGSITFDAEGNPVFALGEGAETAITLQGTITAGKTYYIAVPAQTLAAGWNLSFTTTDDIVYKREGTKQIVLKKNTVINLGTIKLDDFIPYITFSAESEQTFKWNFKPDSNKSAFTYGDGEYFEYRLGYGEWKKIENLEDNLFQATFGNGTILQVRGISSQGTSASMDEWCSIDYYSRISFGNDTKVACSGDIRTLVNYKNYENAETSNARFIWLFENCSQLTSAPDLPATELASNCYYSMFFYCSSLTNAPELPATTLADYCYNNMFQGCSSLTSAPELPATTLTAFCYSFMFLGCSSLKTAPKLPATTLAEYCYRCMFSYCNNIASSIELPAENMYYGCYQYIFDGCESLKEVTVKAKNIYLQNGEGNWDLIELSEIPDEMMFENFEYWLPNTQGTVYCTQELYSLLSQHSNYKYNWTFNIYLW